MQMLDKHKNLLFLAASVAVLAGCGSEEIASPGSGGNVTVNVTTPPPPPPPPLLGKKGVTMAHAQIGVHARHFRPPRL